MSDAAVDSPVSLATREQSWTPRPTDEPISLIDNAGPLRDLDHEASDANASPLPRSSSDPLLARTWTRKGLQQQLQQQLVQRKYARYQEDRYADQDDPRQGSEDEVAAARTKYGLGQGRIKRLLKKQKLRQMADEDAVIDVLYENQRGSLFFGKPFFSSKSLLNFDPKAWVNAHMKTSPVNITNAQVPDPSWEWVWKSWYVDMSRDVDEEGWEYSFSFQNGFAWHGNHPWFHSFVRRRRWLRKRVRKHAHHAGGKTSSQKHISDAHMLTPEYFTIHPSKQRSPGSSRTPSLAASSGGLLKKKADEIEEEDKSDIRDVATLFVFLRKAAIDREKLVLVREFVSNTNAELFYLAEQMHHIMALFIFQNSRRHLLAILMEQFDNATSHREGHKARNEEEGTEEKARTDNLMKAINAADEEVKRLEYWSDIQRIARKGDTMNEPSNWPTEEWQGLDTSGPGSDFRTDAKEEGKSHHDLQKDAELVEERASADLSPSTRGMDKEDGTISGHDEMPLEEPETPIKVDKGKGKAE